MTLARVWNLSSDKKRVHDGSEPGGVFFCHRDYNDFNVNINTDYDVSYADLPYLIRIGRVWVQDAERPDLHSWTEVRKVSDIPKFRKIDGSTYDAVNELVLPFFPEFYFVPNGERGKRFLRKSLKRSECRRN